MFDSFVQDKYRRIILQNFGPHFSKGYQKHPRLTKLTIYGQLHEEILTLLSPISVFASIAYEICLLQCENAF